MSEPISRRDWIKVVGAAGAGSLMTNVSDASAISPIGATPAVGVPIDILPLTSTSDVFVPPRGQAFVKFSFDFPEPSVPFGDYRFGFLVFTAENTYAPDQRGMHGEIAGDEMRVTCDGFVWAGGQERASGRLTANFRKTAGVIEWDIVADADAAGDVEDARAGGSAFAGTVSGECAGVEPSGVL